MTDHRPNLAVTAGPSYSLCLVGAVRLIAFDSTMSPIEALGRIQFTAYDS